MKKQNNLDEMQEQKLLHIEHTCCWLAIWCLVAAITIQGLMGCYLDHILGEIVCLFLLCVHMVTACLKQGIWDRKLVPNWKNNILCALCASLFIGFFTYFQQIVIACILQLSFFRIILSLCIPELAVFAVRIFEKIFVRTVLNKLTVIEHKDPVTKTAG